MSAPNQPLEEALSSGADQDGESQSVSTTSNDGWVTKLENLAHLKKGWNGYEAPPPNEQALASARLYLEALQGSTLEPHRIEASVMGGVGVTHRCNHKKVYVELYNDGKAHALFCDRAMNPPQMQTKPVPATAEGFRQCVLEAKEYLDG